MAINTNKYCEVNLPDRDAVLNGPSKLAQNYQDQSGDWHMNVWEDDIYTDTDRVSFGLYPYVENDTPPADSEYYDRTLSDFTVNADNVSRDAIYTQWEIERVRESKNDELEDQIVEYQANEVAVNPKVNDYINDDVQWLFTSQAEITRETNWQALVDYDTTKPTQLSLPNDYVGSSYVAQGAALSTENEIARNNGLTEPWPQAEVDTFIAANKPAAQDSSGATQPVDPPFELRQGVAKVSEQYNRIVIYRFDVDDPNPALQRNYGMEMRNRQDSRDLYVFSYTGVTYLTWRKFEDQGDGVWGLEGTSAEQQYTDTDMAFIFSYGTNPAVQADYFTDRVEFDAGIDQKKIIVAWDRQ